MGARIYIFSSPDAAKGRDPDSPTPVSGPLFGHAATFRLPTGADFDEDESVVIVGKY